MMHFRPAPAGRPPIFLHTGWRSRGTWVWSALCHEPEVMGFNEPLHEALASLAPPVIAAVHPDAWHGGDAALARSWNEVTGLLRPDLTGVPGFHADFATEHAFAGADAVQPELEAYLHGLLAHATGVGRVPVVKSCRTLGRVAWMQARFPEAVHVVLLRRPDAQWASARREMEVHDNPYFIEMPLLMLARNAEAPVVARACQVLRVPLPRPLCQADRARAAAACRRVVAELSREDRYRGFLAFWVASAVAALATDSLLVDADMLVWSMPYRQEIAAAMALCAGAAFRLGRTSDGNTPVPPLDPEELTAQRAALTLLQEYRATLRPDGYVAAWNMLAAPLVGPAPLAMAPLPAGEPPGQDGHAASPFASWTLRWLHRPWLRREGRAAPAAE